MEKIENAHKLIRWNEKKEHNNSTKDDGIELTEIVGKAHIQENYDISIKYSATQHSVLLSVIA
ncbi:hypothetical protein EFE42_03890 [Methanohalophilus sp. RSK]|uniref:hypothetical protein n=1 Tax=Methanohalophilus sp. RSK TaxID=2485783 RepID=UPI000F43D0CB|nr:hypothetical protein [Methanohalophilus sp. RSK]RNI14527.1 hypothetical protein EFE42_03890 [Methanohalophilus sp. RSK]